MEESFLTEFADRAVAGQCRVAIDIGANTGEWTRWLATKFDHVMAIEPDPRAYAELQNGLPANVYLINAAAGERHATADFHLRPCSKQSSLLETHPIGGGSQTDAPVVETIRVTTLPLDALRDFCRQHFGTDEIDFVKIDVEGSEPEVLAGASPERFAGTRLLVEVHDTQQAVGQQLKRLGRESVRVIKHPSPDAHEQHFWVFSAADAPDAPDAPLPSSEPGDE